MGAGESRPPGRDRKSSYNRGEAWGLGVVGLHSRRTTTRSSYTPSTASPTRGRPQPAAAQALGVASAPRVAN